MVARSLLVSTTLLALASVACAVPADEGGEALGSTAQAITNADVDHDDPAVVALLQDGEAYCTGTLVAPNVVLTAAHCVLPSPPRAVFFGTDPRTGEGRVVAVTRAQAHPRFDEETLRHDIAAVELAEVGPAEPLPMAAPEHRAYAKDREIRLVGFGMPSAGHDDDSRKRSGRTTMSDLTEGDFRFHARPSQTCRGDSGGPALARIDGREVVVGVTSSGDGACRTYGRDIRVDKHTAFLGAFLDEAAATRVAASGGGCAAAPRAPAEGSVGLVLLALGLLGARSRRPLRSPR